LASPAGQQDLVATESAISSAKAAFQKVDDVARTQGHTCGRAAASFTRDLEATSREILKNAYIAKADARCAATNEEYRALPQIPESLRGLANFMDAVVAIDLRLGTDLKTIVPAPADKAEVDKLMADFDRLQAKQVELRNAARAGQAERVVLTADQVDILAGSVYAGFDRFGFLDCGTGE
jgi:hypothetical protein